MPDRWIVKFLVGRLEVRISLVFSRVLSLVLTDAVKLGQRDINQTKICMDYRYGRLAVSSKMLLPASSVDGHRKRARLDRRDAIALLLVSFLADR